MNTAYDVKESAVLVAKLVGVTRDGKIEWFQRSSTALSAMARFQTALDGDLHAEIWSTDAEVGFRILEAEPQLETIGHRREGGARFGSPLLNLLADSTQPLLVSGRDLIAISISHEEGPSRGELYVNLMSLLELARRSADKVEPKIDRVKQYLDKLAV